MIKELLPWATFATVAGVYIFIFAEAIANKRSRKRLFFVQNYQFNLEINKKLLQRYPHLTDEQIAQALEDLRLYFLLVHAYGGLGQIAMPSRVVDAAWHEFIVLTRDYERFCFKAYGKFLHHTPFTNADAENIRANAENTWLWSCEYEVIDPVFPARLPRLFAVDTELDIPDRFGYSLEQGIYPRLAFVTLARGLRKEIKAQLAKTGKQREIAVEILAASFKRLELNCDVESVELLQAVWAHEDLKNAVYGDSGQSKLALESFAKAIKGQLRNETYCKSRGGVALVALFDAILMHEDLRIAIYADHDVVVERKRLESFPEPVNCG